MGVPTGVPTGVLLREARRGVWYGDDIGVLTSIFKDLDIFFRKKDPIYIFEIVLLVKECLKFAH